MNAKQQLNMIVGEELASKWVGIVQDGLQLHREYNLARTEFYKNPSIENEKAMDELSGNCIIRIRHKSRNELMQFK